jgi:hypothetical protein
MVSIAWIEFSLEKRFIVAKPPESLSAHSPIFAQTVAKESMEYGQAGSSIPSGAKRVEYTLNWDYMERSYDSAYNWSYDMYRCRFANQS